MKSLVAVMFFVGLGSLLLAYGMYWIAENTQGEKKKAILCIGRTFTVLGGALATAAWYLSPQPY